MASTSKIARDSGDDVLGPRAAVGALTVAAVDELAVCVVGEHDTRPAAIVLDDARHRIGQLAAARQFDLQERAGRISETTGPQTNGRATLMNGLHGGAIDVVPELHDLRMRRAPFVLEDVSTSSSVNLPGSKIRHAFKPP